MSSAIMLPEQLYEQLLHKSRQVQRTPEEMVTDLIRQYLSEPENRWQDELQALFACVHARTASFPSDEIEADITQAASDAGG